MSTKIYEAYRTKPGVKLFNLVEKLRTVVNKSVKKTLLAHYKMWETTIPLADLQSMWAEAYPNQTGVKDKFNNLDYSAMLRQKYAQQIGKPERSFWDLNLSISIRQQGNKFYLIPLTGSFWYGDRNPFKALKRLPELEDYAYWNNTDEPRGMDHKAWKLRGKTWDKMFQKWESNYLFLDIVSLDTFYQVCPSWDIL